jgi:heat shock protein HslJ
MKTGVLVLALAAWPFAAGPATTPPDAAPPLDGTSWILSTLGGHAPAGHERVTLEFKSGRLQGTDGCNQYSGPYSASGTRLRISPDLVSTQMACPAEIMQLAGAYMSMLLAVQGYRINDKELDLLGTAGNVVATFAAQSPSATGIGLAPGSSGREPVRE